MDQHPTRNHVDPARATQSGAPRFARLYAAVTSFLSSRDRLTLLVTMLLVMMALTPPNGVLNENEEHYLEVARAFVSPEGSAALDSLLGGIPHTFAFSWLAGLLVDWLGYGGAQIAGRALVALLYAWAFTTLFRALSLGVGEALLAVLTFYVCGEQIVGGEWLFGSFEPKTLAYPLALMGIAAHFARQPLAPWLWFAAATTIHFQIGALWMLLVALCRLLEGESLRRLSIGAGAYALAIVPVAAVVLINHVDLVGEADSSLPDPSWIYTFHRAPHHVAPFVDFPAFIEDWLPGLTALAALTVLATLMVRGVDHRTAEPARLALAAFVFLWLALILSALDEGGRLGPYMLFRISSLALLLFITAALLSVRYLAGAGAFPLLSGALLLCAALAAPPIAEVALTSLTDEARRGREHAALYEFVRATPQDTVFLIDPRLERRLLGFQRETGRSVPVLFKFMPSRAEATREWYRRTEWRKQVFGGDCRRAAEHRVTHLIVGQAARHPAAACGTLAHQDERFSVIRVGATG